MLLDLFFLCLRSRNRRSKHGISQWHADGCKKVAKYKPFQKQKHSISPKHTICTSLFSCFYFFWHLHSWDSWFFLLKIGLHRFILLQYSLRNNNSFQNFFKHHTTPLVCFLPTPELHNFTLSPFRSKVYTAHSQTKFVNIVGRHKSFFEGNTKLGWVVPHGGYNDLKPEEQWKRVYWGGFFHSREMSMRFPTDTYKRSVDPQVFMKKITFQYYYTGTLVVEAILWP